MGDGCGGGGRLVVSAALGELLGLVGGNGEVREKANSDQERGSWRLHDE